MIVKCACRQYFYEKDFCDIKNRVIIKDYILHDSQYIENIGFGYVNILDQFLYTSPF